MTEARATKPRFAERHEIDWRIVETNDEVN
jgi:hypothetical protein